MSLAITSCGLALRPELELVANRLCYLSLSDSMSGQEAKRPTFTPSNIKKPDIHFLSPSFSNIQWRSYDNTG